MTFIALHGFLGSPDDWKGIDEVYHALSVDPLSEKDSLEKWAERQLQDALFHEEPKWLIGYSMGGRAALYLLAKQPEKFCGAVIISANIGLKTDAERLIRKKNDQEWAKKFLNSPLEDVLKQWNEQAVFHGSTEQTLNLKKTDKKKLHDTLIAFSYSKQPDFEEMIAALKIPILWIGGEHDPGFKAVKERLKLAHPKSKIWIAEGAGHRVMLDKSKETLSQIKQFFSQA